MIFLVLTVVQTNLFNLTTHVLTGLEQPESYQKAADIIDVLLLSPGSPPDWWDYTKYPNPENITSIGLALEGEADYVLDLRKLARLNSSSAEYLSPSFVRSLLGLRSYYDFSLKITPVFQVSIANASGEYTVQVSDINGAGVPNSNVTAFYIPSSIQTGIDYAFTSQRTGEDGSCVLTFAYDPEYGVIVNVNHIGVTVLASKPENLKLRVVGSHLFEAQYPLVTDLDYGTAFPGSATHTEIVHKYVQTDGVYYHVEFTLWE
jgi:hypothetical protein